MRQQDGKSATHLVAFEGGPSRHLADGPVRPTWTPDGRAVWAGARTGAVRVDPETGAVTRRIEPPAGYEILSVRELPDGRLVARFWDHDLTMVKGVGVYPAGGGAPRLITEDALSDAAALSPDGRWLVGGHISREEGLELKAYPIEGGAPVLLASKQITPAAGMVFSKSGDRMLWSSCRSRSRVGTLKREGGKLVAEEAAAPPGEWLDRQPAWVPGTSRIVVVSTRVSGQRLWVLDRTEREPPRQLGSGEGTADAPAVSPDGQWVVFALVGDGLHVLPTAGGAPRRLTKGPDDTAPSFSRDGSTVYFQTRGEGGRPRLDAVPFGGGATTIVRERAARPAPSPSANRMAFVALGETGDEGVPMIRDLRTGQEQPLSAEVGRGRHPGIRFSPDGKRVAVLEGTTAVVEVDAQSGAVQNRWASGNEDITGLAYAGEEIVITARTWFGNLWIADDPFPRTP
ncbi:MAG: LpqB family beta-propeller domain-containing protein [Minicystis sp.]